MPLPRRLARFNRRVTNPIVRRVAGSIPPLAIVEHAGRRSGTRYRTPVMIFMARDGSGDVVVALTYGPDTEWVRNVVAAGGCALAHRRRTFALVQPRLFESSHPPADIPGPVRWVLRRLKVRFFLRLSRDS